MNHLEPELKRLMNWARHGLAPKPDQAPLGFSRRVLAGLESEQTAPSPLVFERLVAISAWASTVVIVCGLIFFASQTRSGESVLNFTSAYQFLAKNILP
ncbi:MAG: hypothetical protein HY735_10735 [Verrucomicrobia bacterium]|nr:hypothetical protein [Verrucomicrobiota bacterium]